MRFFLPYLNTTYVPSVPDTESLTILWTMNESDWLSWLEKKEEVRPFLKFLRQLEGMIHYATKSIAS
jgi:hypothetical protein